MDTVCADKWARIVCTDATAVNRLDRLTSGLMILGLSSRASRDLAMEFANKEVKKEYVARVKGKFPE